MLAGNASVDPAIRKRVWRAAAQLGINLEERRKDRSKIIAFLLGNRDVLHSFQGHVLFGAEKYCSERKWELLFMAFRYGASVPHGSLHLPQLLEDRTNARAAILGGANTPNLIEALRGRAMPFAVLGNNVIGAWQPEACDVVYSDDVGGAQDVTAHLVAKGHKAIAFIGNLSLTWFERCALGYRRGMTAAGLEPRCVDLRFDGIELGYLGTKSLLNQPERVTAILAGSDQVAAGVYDALREASISIPGEMSVVGFNDTQASLFYPQLTSIQEFPEELGHYLVEFVLNRLQNPDMPPQSVTIPTRLISRDSVRALNS
jgi:DNA-binding LacI/PurR family transcriptional regulator